MRLRRQARLAGGPPADAPELPAAARPRWPAWNAPAALFGTLALLLFFAPALPVLLLGFGSEDLEALALLLLVLMQDGILMAAALLFAGFTVRPRAWHFGVRRTRLWPTVAWTVVGFAVLLGFEIGWTELLGVDESDIDEELPGDGVISGFLLAIAVIVVAPVAEEFFFRGFFYRALRSRLGIAASSSITGVLFALIHFQYYAVPLVLVVIAVFGIGQCLVYERTSSLFAVIAIHAAFNAVAALAVAVLPAIVVGALMLLACLIVPRRLRREPSPFGLEPRAAAARA